MAAADLASAPTAFAEPGGPKLSVAIITRDEAHCIERCLRALEFADEIVILDSGSQDATVGIARSLGAKVFERRGWPGFGPQKNLALSLTRGTWVLSIDADEVVTPELAASIRTAIEGTAFDGWWIRRVSTFCGRPIRFGDWRNDRVLRLFRRSAGRFSEDLVHERVIVAPPHGVLEGLLLHDSIDSLDDARVKMLRYARAGADKLRARGRTGGLVPAMLHAVWTLVRGLFLRAGVLDGWRGIAIAVFNARGTYLRYRWAALPPQNPPGDQP